MNPSPNHNCTALARPEAIEPTDEDLKAWRQAAIAQFEASSYDIPASRTVALLAIEWCRKRNLSAITPIPVSERLPGPEDCDAEGRCWWWAHQDGDYSDDWRWSATPSERIYGDNWGWKYLKSNEFWRHGAQAWAPHWSIPLPQPTTEESQW